MATNTAFKVPRNVFDPHDTNKPKSHKCTHKCQTLVSKVKTYEQKRVAKLNTLWSSFTEHGKNDVSDAVHFHQDILNSLRLGKEQTGVSDSSNFQSDVEQPGVNIVDTEHARLELDNLEDVRDDNDDYFEK